MSFSDMRTRILSYTHSTFEDKEENSTIKQIFCFCLENNICEKEKVITEKYEKTKLNHYNNDHITMEDTLLTEEDDNEQISLLNDSMDFTKLNYTHPFGDL